MYAAFIRPSWLLRSGPLLIYNMQKALGLGWRSSTRVLIHLADYPCHGREYHDYIDPVNDAHMDGDPLGKQLLHDSC